MRHFLISLVLLTACNRNAGSDDKYSMNSENNIDADTSTIRIFPGQGIDDIKLGTSTFDEVAKFRNDTFRVDSSKGHAHGATADVGDFIFYVKKYSSPLLGVTFVFRSDYIPEQLSHEKQNIPLTLQSIFLNKNACLLDSICIGGNNYYQEVTTKLGPFHPEWRKKRYLHFKEKGVALYLDTNGIIKEVEVFLPVK